MGSGLGGRQLLTTDGWNGTPSNEIRSTHRIVRSRRGGYLVSRPTVLAVGLLVNVILTGAANVLL